MARATSTSAVTSLASSPSPAAQQRQGNTLWASAAPGPLKGKDVATLVRKTSRERRMPTATPPQATVQARLHDPRPATAPAIDGFVSAETACPQDLAAYVDRERGATSQVPTATEASSSTRGAAVRGGQSKLLMTMGTEDGRDASMWSMPELPEMRASGGKDAERPSKVTQELSESGKRPRGAVFAIVVQITAAPWHAVFVQLCPVPPSRPPAFMALAGRRVRTMVGDGSTLPALYQRANEGGRGNELAGDRSNAHGRQKAATQPAAGLPLLRRYPFPPMRSRPWPQLDGDFDEEASKAAFQAALLEWRSGGSGAATKADPGPATGPARVPTPPRHAPQAVIEIQVPSEAAKGCHSLSTLSFASSAVVLALQCEPHVPGWSQTDAPPAAAAALRSVPSTRSYFERLECRDMSRAAADKAQGAASTSAVAVSEPQGPILPTAIEYPPEENGDATQVGLGRSCVSDCQGHVPLHGGCDAHLSLVPAGGRGCYSPGR